MQYGSGSSWPVRHEAHNIATRVQHWAGVVSRDGSSPDVLLGRIQRTGRPDALSWRGERAAVAFGPPAPRADFTAARISSLLVAFDGRLDNLTELARSCGLARTTPLPHVLASAYRKHGSALLAQMSGDFALALYDTVRGTLLLARDAVGARPIYYAQTSGSIAFAGAIEPLRHALTRTPRPRLDALATLLCAPQAVQLDETFLSGIHALPPAHVLISTNLGTQIEQYWQSDAAPFARLSVAESAEAMHALLRESVRRRVQGAARVAVLLDGSPGSSATLFVAREFCSAVTGIYHGSPVGRADEEAAYIELLGQAGPIVRVAVWPAGYPGGLSALVQESETPLSDCMPARHTRIVRTARASGASTILHGQWADQVSFFDVPGRLNRLQGPELLRRLRSLAGWFSGGSGISRVLNAALLPGRRRAVALRWSSAATRWARTLEQQVWSRRDTLLLEGIAKSAAAHGLHSALPFLDRELLTLLCALPDKTRERDHAAQALLRTAMSGVVPAPLLEPRSTGNYTAAADSVLRASAAQVLAELRNGRLVACGFVDARAVAGDLRALSRQARLEEPAATRVLAALYAVECWLRLFSDD